MSKAIRNTFIIVGVLAVLILLMFSLDKEDTPTPSITGNVVKDVEESSDSSDSIEDAVKELELLNDAYENNINSEYLHFPSREITYSMKGIDRPGKRDRMIASINELEEAVGEFSFVEIDDYDKAEIKIDFQRANNLGKASEVIPEIDKDGKLLGGTINIIKIEDDCLYHVAEMRDLLILFGFNYKDKTIMQESIIACHHLTSGNSIEYVEHLKFIYSNGQRGVEHSDLPMFGLSEETQFECTDGWVASLKPDENCCRESNIIIGGKGYCY